MHKANFNQGRIIPPIIRWPLTLILLTAIYYSMSFLEEKEAITSSILLSFLIPTIWSAYHLVELDLDNKKLRKYFWIVGRKIFRDEIIITSEKIQSRQANGKFEAYVETNNQQIFVLVSDKTAEGLNEKLIPTLNKLDIKINNSDKN